MKKPKYEKGITLVALIITIVILIVLAVVSITTIMNTDILGYADKSVNIYEKNKDNETETLQGYEDYLAGNNSKGNILRLIDVPETKENMMTYSVNNGLFTLSGPDWYEYSSYYRDDGWCYYYTEIKLPCVAKLQKGKTYEININCITNNGAYVFECWRLIDDKNKPCTSKILASEITCTEDIYANFISFDVSANGSWEMKYDGWDENNDMLWTGGYYFCEGAQYNISIVEK